MTLSIIFLIISNLFFGTTNVLWKKPQQDTGTLSLIIARSFCNLLIFGTITLVLGDFGKWDWNMGLKAILYCFINYFGLFFYLKSLQEKKVSEVVGLSKIGTVFGILIGVFYFHETLSAVKMAVIIMILVCVFLIENFSGLRKNFYSKGFLYVLLSSIFWSSFFLFKEPIDKFGIFLFSFILETVVCLISFALLKIKGEKLKIKPLKNHRRDFTLLVILGSVAIITAHYVLEKLPVTLRVILYLITPVTTLFISRIYLEEKLTKEQWVGIFVGIFALFVLNYF